MARMFHDWDIPTVNTQVAKATTPDASADRDSRGAASIPARLPKVAQVLPTDYRAGEREDIVTPTVKTEPTTTTEPITDPIVEPITEPKTVTEPPKNPPSGGTTQFVEYEYNADFTKRRAKYFNSATGAFTYGSWETPPKTKEDYDKEQADAAAKAAAFQEKRDAFSMLEATMRSYGFNETELKEITEFMQKGLIDPNMGPNQITLAMRQLNSYKSRFAGNEERRARNLNTLSEVAYLQQEKDYSATLREAGMQRFVTREQFATLIGNDISNTELGKRVRLANERVKYSDPNVLKQLRSYYNITEEDIAAYYLSPKDVLPELEAKTTTAEIGSAALQFGLSAEKERAQGLQTLGIDLERARSGYSNIAGVLPRTQQLSDIYSETGIKYTQTTAEEEEFKGLASAKRAREKLKEREFSSFMGSSGTGKTSLMKGTAGSI